LYLSSLSSQNGAWRGLFPTIQIGRCPSASTIGCGCLSIQACKLRNPPEILGSLASGQAFQVVRLHLKEIEQKQLPVGTIWIYYKFNQ
jgi:hypothetical protein